MAAQSFTAPAVPIADRALDSASRAWHLLAPSLDPYASLWECPATGAGATWAQLNVAHGVFITWNSRMAVAA